MTQEVLEKIRSEGPKRVLSLDGGGVRGLITLGYLERLEAVLADRHGVSPEAFPLHRYFDLIGGASTGAVIATLLALGWRPREISDLYREILPSVFRRRGYSWKGMLAAVGFETKFDGGKFSSEMTKAFGMAAKRAGVPPEKLTLATDQLKTGLAIVTKRIDTGAVWVQTNNPLRKYWTPENPNFWQGNPRFFPNRDYNLKTIVQASASAPYFVDPVELEIDPDQLGLFVDGGASPHNNPSKELFLMATLRPFSRPGAPAAPTPYGFGWRTGADQLLMISIGTGYFRNRIKTEEYRGLPEVKQAIHALRTIIADNDQEAVTWMQALSEPVDPWRINGKLETMDGLRIVEEPLLSYQRYNASIEGDALAELMGADWARDNLKPRMLQQLHEFDVAAKTNIDRLTEIGRRAGDALVTGAHFPHAFDKPAI